MTNEFDRLFEDIIRADDRLFNESSSIDEGFVTKTADVLDDIEKGWLAFRRKLGVPKKPKPSDGSASRLMLANQIFDEELRPFIVIHMNDPAAVASKIEEVMTEIAGLVTPEDVKWFERQIERLKQRFSGGSAPAAAEPSDPDAKTKVIPKGSMPDSGTSAANIGDLPYEARPGKKGLEKFKDAARKAIEVLRMDTADHKRVTLGDKFIALLILTGAAKDIKLD